MRAQTVMHLAIGDREHSAKVVQLSPARSDAYEEGLGERLLYDVAYRHYLHSSVTVLLLYIPPG